MTTRKATISSVLSESFIGVVAWARRDGAGIALSQAKAGQA
jgi:hypothetical protein